MKLIFITLFLFFYISVTAETKIFKVAYIDLKNDVRYSDWGRHPVDIRSSHNKEQRAVDGARVRIMNSKNMKEYQKQKLFLNILRYIDEKKLLKFFQSESPKEYNAILLDLNFKNLKNIQSSIKDKNQVIFFNVSNSNNSLRTNGCIDNLYHTYPSDMMKTDALAQFLVQKNGIKL